MPKRNIQNDMKARARVASEFLGKFCVERYCFLAINVISAGFLICCALYLVIKNKADTMSILGLFGPTGVIAFTTGRMLTMWNDALKFVSGNER